MEMKMGGACSVTVDNGNGVHQHLSITFMVLHQHLQCYTDLYSATLTLTVLHQHLQYYTNFYSVTPTFTVPHQHLQYYINIYSVTPTLTVCEVEEDAVRVSQGDITGVHAGPPESGCLA